MQPHYLVEPTDENLQRYQREANGTKYWHTADFFRYDKTLEDCLSDLFDAYTGSRCSRVGQ